MLIEVPTGGGFTDMVALKGDKEIGDKIIGRLAEARMRDTAERCHEGRGNPAIW